MYASLPCGATTQPHRDEPIFVMPFKRTPPEGRSWRHMGRNLEIADLYDKAVVRADRVDMAERRLVERWTGGRISDAPVREVLHRRETL